MRHRKVGVVMGDGHMAAQCAKRIADQADMVRPVVIHHDHDHDRDHGRGRGREWSFELQKVTRKLCLPHFAVKNVNDPESISLLQDIRPDIVFSVNNWDVIHKNLLSIPRDGIINFHNGPLPQYRGVNAPSWAIINREQSFGVTWHFVAEKIDAGDIVASSSFDLSRRETAISLMFRCMETGMELFGPLLERYSSGTLRARPQEGEGHYFSARASPDGGYLDFRSGFSQLSALVRGLTFRPFDNQFTYPKIRIGRNTLLLTAIDYHGSRKSTGDWTAGEIRKVDNEGIVVCSGDCLVRISGLMEEDGSESTDLDLAHRYGLVEGTVLKPRLGTSASPAGG